MLDAQKKADDDENTAFVYGVAVGLFPVAPLLMALALPSVKAGDANSWQIDTIWELVLGLLASVIVGGIFGFFLMWMGLLVGVPVSYWANRKRAVGEQVDSENIAAAMFGACGTGIILVLVAVVIKSFVLNY